MGLMVIIIDLKKRWFDIKARFLKKSICLSTYSEKIIPIYLVDLKYLRNFYFSKASVKQHFNLVVYLPKT